MKKLMILLLCGYAVLSHASDEKIVKEFTVDDIPSLSLSNVAGDITIHRGEDRTVLIHAINPNPEVEVTMRQDGRKITVKTKYPRHSRNIHKGVTFEIWLPATSEMEINTVSGDFEMKEIAGDISINTVSGDIDITQCSGDLDLNTVSGDIEIRELGNCDFEANAVSGDILLSEISLQKGDYELNTTSGDIQIIHGKTASYTISGQSVSGDMDVDGIQGVRVKKAKYSGMRSVNGTYQGGEADLDINSVSGDLSISLK